MSLINQMLRDLDARRAAHGAGNVLPNDVRPLPARRPARWPVVLGGLALLVVAGGLAVRQFELMQPAVPPPPAAPPAQVVAPVIPVAPVAPVAPVLAPAAPMAEVEPPVAAEPVAAAPSLQKKTTEKALKAPDAAGDKMRTPAPAPARAMPTAPPLPTASERAPSTESKPVKGPTIARSDSLGSPRERSENEYRKAIGAVNQGRVAEAVDGLARALRDDSLHIGARQLLVKLLLEAKRFDEALAVLRDGLQGQPAQIGWAMTLARLQVDRGDLAGAWQTLDDSLPAAGHSADYQGFAAHLLQRLGRQREAAERYQAATRLAPGDGRWWLGLGLAAEAEGDSAQAREAFQRARQSGNLSPELTALAEQKLR
jgi:MSHA biogenesis protein MshN